MMVGGIVKEIESLDHQNWSWLEYKTWKMSFETEIHLLPIFVTSPASASKISPLLMAAPRGRTTINLPFNSTRVLSKQVTHQQLAELWEAAVKRYSKDARLTKAEEEVLRKSNTPDEVFDSAKINWDKNVIENRWKCHDMAQQTVGQVLGMFDILDAALGFAAAVPYSTFLQLTLCAEFSTCFHTVGRGQTFTSGPYSFTPFVVTSSRMRKIFGKCLTLLNDNFWRLELSLLVSTLLFKPKKFRLNYWRPWQKF